MKKLTACMLLFLGSTPILDADDGKPPAPEAGTRKTSDGPPGAPREGANCYCCNTGYKVTRVRYYETTFVMDYTGKCSALCAACPVDHCKNGHHKPDDGGTGGDHAMTVSLAGALDFFNKQITEAAFGAEGKGMSAEAKTKLEESLKAKLGVGAEVTLGGKSTHASECEKLDFYGYISVVVSWCIQDCTFTYCDVGVYDTSFVSLVGLSVHVANGYDKKACSCLMSTPGGNSNVPTGDSRKTDDKHGSLGPNSPGLKDIPTGYPKSATVRVTVRQPGEYFPIAKSVQVVDPGKPRAVSETEDSTFPDALTGTIITVGLAGGGALGYNELRDFKSGGGTRLQSYPGQGTGFRVRPEQLKGTDAGKTVVTVSNGAEAVELQPRAISKEGTVLYSSSGEQLPKGQSTARLFNTETHSIVGAMNVDVGSFSPVVPNTLVQGQQTPVAISYDGKIDESFRSASFLAEMAITSPNVVFVEGMASEFQSPTKVKVRVTGAQIASGQPVAQIRGAAPGGVELLLKVEETVR